MILPDSDLEFLVAQAVMAPSGHNTQPWLFRRVEGGVEILPDRRRALPVVDPDDRELFISLGCAAENLVIAAAHRGYQARVSVNEGAGTIRIALAQQSATVQPLFSSIAQRQTNRSLYSGQMLHPHHLALLQGVAREPGVVLRFFAKGTADFDQIADCVCEGNTRQMQNPAFKDELRRWLRYNRQHQDETRDGLSYAVFGAPNVPRFVAACIMGLMMNARTQNRADRRKIASSSHLVLFSVAQESIPQWVDVGRSLQRLLLTATGLGIAHAYLNQPCEERELAQQMARNLGLPDEIPVLLLRLGYAQTQAWSLRRPVEAVIIRPDAG